MYNRSVQVTINLQQENENSEKIQSNTYHFSGGLVEYVLWLNHDKVSFMDNLFFTSF
jgi:DNA gyrase/topoisomerase IV subunit B